MAQRRPIEPWMLSVWLGAVACAPEEESVREIPAVTWSGANLDYAPQPGAYALCEGTLPYMDRYVELVANAMGVKLERPVVYVHGSEEGESFCEQEGTLGCSFDDSVYSLVAPQEHELVHGVRGHEGFSQLFFEEGTAEVFGDDAALGLRVTSNGDLQQGIEAASGEHGLPQRWYPRAGHFVAYLHDRYGSGVTAAILRETDAYSSASRAMAVVETATGVPWAELREEYEALPECDQPHYRYPLYGCEEPTALRQRCDGHEAVWITERIACDDPTTLGPRDGELWKTIAVEIPEDGEYLFFSYSDAGGAGASITVEECSMRCDKIVLEQPLGLELPLVPVVLRAGRYALRLTQGVGEGGWWNWRSRGGTVGEGARSGSEQRHGRNTLRTQGPRSSARPTSDACCSLLEASSLNQHLLLSEKRGRFRAYGFPPEMSASKRSDVPMTGRYSLSVQQPIRLGWLGLGISSGSFRRPVSRHGLDFD